LDVNVNSSSFTIGTFTTNSAATLSDGGSQNVDGMGTFNQTVDASDGFGSRFTIGSFILTDASGSWASPSQVLTANMGGGSCPFPPGCDAAAHVAPLSENGNVTGFVGEAVPAPVIGHGLLVLFAVGGVLFGGKLLEGLKKRQLHAA
jgi:hypothetical protein